MRDINETVQDSFDGRLIKDFLRLKLGFSVTLIKKVKYGGVFVNGDCVTMRKILHSGDTVSVKFPTEDSEHVNPIDESLTVLYEDEYILAVDKPTGMPTHPSRYNSLPTLAALVRSYIGRPFVFRAITRLDRDTSGIVLIAKDQLSAARLSADMKSGSFEKTYTAILANAPSENEGVIDAPIERESEDSIKRTVRPDGKPSVTKYKVEEILPDGRAVCTFIPLTGRTHQIRVHSAYIGCPLYNDFLYGERIGDGTYSLRCARLSFPHPVTSERLEITVD